MPFQTRFKPTLPRAPNHRISIAALVLIVAVTTAGIYGLFAEPQHANAWMTDTGANWKSTSAYELDPADWVNTGSTLPSNLSLSQLAVIGDYVYLFGGFVSDYTNVIRRAPLSNPTSWSNVGTLPSNLAYSQLAIIGDYVYLFGGHVGGTNGYTNKAIYRAPVSNPTNWTDTGATLPGNVYASSLAIIGDYVYLFGGRNANSGGHTNVIYRAPLSNPISWTNTGSTLPGNLAHSQAAIIGDYVYLFGGATGGSNQNIIYRAPVSNPTSWTNTGSTLPGNLYDSQLATIGDYVYLFSGFFTNVIYRAPVSNPTNWTDTGATLPSVLHRSSLAIIGDYVYLFGGNATNVIYRAPLTALTPATPGTPTFSNVTSTSMRVSWTAASGADSYKLERCEGAGCSTFTEIASGITDLFYDDTGLTPNTSYSYRVRGTNAQGDGPYSSTGTQTTAAGPPTVTTNPATAVATTSATLNGTITGSGGITEHGFAYGTSADLTTGVSTTTLGGASGISFVGGTQNAAANASVTVDISGLSLEEGDVVLVTNAINNGTGGDTNPGVQTSGYTEVADIFGDGTQNDLNLSVNWKVMGASPDSSVACNSSGSATLASVCIVQAYRGVDTASPMDVSPATATGAGSGIPNPASITPSTSGAWVVVAGGGGAASQDTSVTAPSGYTDQTEDTLDPGNAATAAMASKAWTSGAEDPAAWTNWATTGSGASWAAVTIALRPATIGGAFEESVSSLSAGTTYYFRAYATNTGGTGFGSILSFATPGGSCTFNGQPIPHGSSTTAYQSQIVPYGESCVSEQRTCTDGTLSGSYQYATCSPASPPPAGTAINGWAWSETIGWLSLNGTTYGLYVNEDAELEGYAWSENIGWVSANESDLTGCPQSPCAAYLNSDSLSGWLRALGADDEEAGGWDGWIALNDMNLEDDNDYGVALASGQFSGFAWGDENVGWLDFGYATTSYAPCTGNYQCNPDGTYDNLCTPGINENQACGAGLVCSPGAVPCVLPADANGNLFLNPSLVPAGTATQVSWSVQDTNSCHVYGENGDEWFGGATGAATSSAIVQTTLYTLECANLFGEATTTVDTASAVVVPTWVER